MSVNKAILLGYVGNDPEIRYPEKDKPVAYLSLATNETTKGGLEVTEWHKLVVWGDNARIVERYIRKGTQLYVEGKITTREYQDRMKITRQRTEILVSFFEIVGRRPENQSTNN
ncbi:MAG: single-stranded DNA-binding protein [Muribaculaceae bacterium]|nr:single-stranded DNA-binding protein [Muribaculaceae bacterium]